MNARTAARAAAFTLALGLLFPATSAAASEGGDRWGVLLTVGRFFNLGVVIAVLVWVGRKPLQRFMADRSDTIRRQLAEAQGARREAEAKLQEIEGRMSRLDAEVAELAASADRDARAEHERLLAEAERDAEKIVTRARQEIEGLTRAAELALRREAAELSIRLAEERIRSDITDDDRKRLFSRFVGSLEGRQR
jgi:F-type H+-transporting ATPase subunit b